jgi:type VI protein secretion system component Hcp
MELAELYLDLEGPSGTVAGDATGLGYEGEIDITDWSWGLKLSEQWSKGEVQGGSTDRSEPGQLEFSKRLDRSSTALMRGAMQLAKFPKARITMLHRVWKSVKLIVALEGVRIDSYELTVTDEEKSTSATEKIKLSFESIRLEYKPRDTAGGSKGSATGAVRSFEMRARKA